MKIRFRGPSGGGSVELDDDATVTQLLSALKEQTGGGNIAVKFGWPLQTLSSDQGDLQLQYLGLHRESLTIVPLEGVFMPAVATAAVPVPARASQPADVKTASLDAQLAATLSYGSGEHVTVDMPESRTTLGTCRTEWLMARYAATRPPCSHSCSWS
jgi:ubiquitin thioesterase OTU1